MMACSSLVKSATSTGAVLGMEATSIVAGITGRIPIIGWHLAEVRQVAGATMARS
jgi:hypothetical protein